MTEAMEVRKQRGEGRLATLILKGTNNSTADRDAGFCSGGDEDDLEIEDDIHSPTDASEDSVEVKVTPISSRNKNKRKCAEPRKVEEISTGPLKKRIRFEMKQESMESSSGRASPFRPWSVPSRSLPPTSPTAIPIPYHPVYGYQVPSISQQEEPLSLVKKESPKQRRNKEDCSTTIKTKTVPESNLIRPKEFAKLKTDVKEIPRVPPHPAVRPPTTLEIEEKNKSPGFSVESLLSPQPGPSKSDKTSSKDQKEQRNYKNMTRERRIEANARERTRVHTISAAFDTLRRAVPAYSHNQKLSKLSVLRIACSYILTLSRVAGNDYSADQSSPSLASCVDLVSRTIQTEGKLRKKKDE